MQHVDILHDRHATELTGISASSEFVVNISMYARS